MPTTVFEFRIHGERLAIARLPADAALPDWVRGEFTTVSRTPGELSIVCAQHGVPATVKHERDRIALGIVGEVPMTTIGVLASLCGTLAAARVPVFVISTHDTDYLLVTATHFAVAREALIALGHRVVGRMPA